MQVATRSRYQNYLSKRHIRPLRTILFGLLGLMVILKIVGSANPNHNTVTDPNHDTDPNPNYNPNPKP